MRILTAMLFALAGAGCTVTVGADHGNDASPLLREFRPGEFMQAFAASAQAVVRAGGGAEGMTRHEGRAYHQRRYAYRFEGRPEDPQAFSRRLRAELKDAVGRHVKISGEGDGTIGEGEFPFLHQFDFTYLADGAWGWVTVTCSEVSNGMLVTLDIHEAQI